MIGAHSDYGLGRVTGVALNKGIYFAYKKDELPAVVAAGKFKNSLFYML